MGSIGEMMENRGELYDLLVDPKVPRPEMLRRLAEALESQKCEPDPPMSPENPLDKRDVDTQLNYVFGCGLRIAQDMLLLAAENADERVPPQRGAKSRLLRRIADYLDFYGVKISPPIIPGKPFDFDKLSPDMQELHSQNLGLVRAQEIILDAAEVIEEWENRTELGGKKDAR